MLTKTAFAKFSNQASETPIVPCRHRSERVANSTSPGKFVDKRGHIHKWTQTEDLALAEGMLKHGSKWALITGSNSILKGLGRKRCCQRSKTMEFKMLI